MAATHPSPGIYSILTDESGFNPDDISAGKLALFHSFSDRGEDNKIKLMPGILNSLKEYGTPKYSRYGLGLHSANKWLEGGSSAFICRLMPSDARYSHLTFSVIEKEHLQNTIIAPYTGNYNYTATTGTFVYSQDDAAFYEAIATVLIEDSFNLAGTTWQEADIFSELTVYTSNQVVQNADKTKLYKSIAGSTAGQFDAVDWTLIGDITVSTIEYDEIIHDPFIGAWANFSIDTKYCSYQGRFYNATANVEIEETFNSTPGTWVLVNAFDEVSGYNVNSIVTDSTSKKLYKANKKIDPKAFDIADWNLIGEIVAYNNYRPLLIDPFVGIYGGTAVTGKTVYYDNLFYTALQDIASETSFNKDGNTWSKVLKYKAYETYTIGELVTNTNSTILYKCKTAITKPEAFSASKWTVIGNKVTGGNVLNVFNDTLTEFDYTTKDIIGTKTVPKSGDLPFLTLYPTGRGLDYNKLTIKFEENLSFKDTFDFKIYDLTIFDVSSTGSDIVLESNISFSLKPSAVDLSGASMFLPDVLNDYASIIRADVNFSQIITDKLISYLSGKTGINITFDTLFNYDILGDIIDTDIKFEGGSNGSLLDTTFNRLVPEIASSLINEFYLGSIDPKILNPKEVDASFVFDIALPLNNKYDISDFTKYTRNDVFAYLTDSYSRNEEALLDFRLDDFNVDNRFASLRAGSGVAFDDYSGQYISVPYLYQIIQSISYNTRELGVHIPNAGYDSRGIVTGIKAETHAFSPTKLYEDKFYLNQINHPVKEIDGIFYLSTRTLQKYNSSLSNESIVQTVQEIQRDTERMGKLYMIKLITESLLTDIDSDYKNYFSKWITNGALETANVYVISNRIDRKNNRVRVFFELTFSGILEKLILNTIVK